MSLAISGDTIAYLMTLGLEPEQMKGLIDRLQRDAIALAPPSTLNGVNEERERLRNESTYAERKRAKDRERMRLYRATDWGRLREAVFERDNFSCVYCGTNLVHEEPHCDHVLPFSRGGTNDIDNLATACGPCNLAKGDNTPDEWRSAP